MITQRLKEWRSQQEKKNLLGKLMADESLLVSLPSADILKLLRPHQWTKNLFCLAGLIFGGKLLEPAAIADALAITVAFCAASSAVYIFNDIQDRERDRQHPKKRSRPIASGKVSVASASFIAIFLVAFSWIVAHSFGAATLGCVVFYGIVNVAYSLGLKNQPLFDVSCIAFGFVLRLFAGVYALDDIPTGWITLCTFFLSLFLGFAKRRSELLGLLSSRMTQEFLESQETEGSDRSKSGADLFKLQLFYQRGNGNKQRPVLSEYTLSFLDSLVESTATMTVICYALFTTTSGTNPSLVITVPIVHDAVTHYRHLVMVQQNGEEPDKILLKDTRLKLSILIWLICYLTIIYTKARLFV